MFQRPAQGVSDVVSRFIACSALVVAGLLSLVRTALGVLYAVGFAIDSVESLITVLCLTLALPIYAISFKSLRIATLGLWILVGLNWINTSLISVPITVANPFEWPYGSHLIAATALVQLAYSLLLKMPNRNKPVRFGDAFVSRF